VFAMVTPMKKAFRSMLSDVSRWYNAAAACVRALLVYSEVKDFLSNRKSEVSTCLITV